MNLELWAAITEAVEKYPRLRWRLEDGYRRLWAWHDERGVRFVETAILPPRIDCYGESVMCSIDAEGQELSIRNVVSPMVVGVMKRDDFTRHVIENMVQQLAREYFKSCPQDGV